MSWYPMVSREPGQPGPVFRVADAPQIMEESGEALWNTMAHPCGKKYTRIYHVFCFFLKVTVVFFSVSVATGKNILQTECAGAALGANFGTQKWDVFAWFPLDPYCNWLRMENYIIYGGKIIYVLGNYIWQSYMEVNLTYGYLCKSYMVICHSYVSLNEQAEQLLNRRPCVGMDAGSSYY